MNDSSPTTLADIAFATTYRKGDSDIVHDFLVPCFKVSHRYDRAVGFFSSSVYALAWDGLRPFLTRGGSIRILCSPRVSPDDALALERGHSVRSSADLARSAIAELEAMLASPQLKEPTLVLATMVATGKLDLRFVEVAHDDTGRFLYHDKAGVFVDNHDNAVLFKGSMNETWSGVSPDGNIESIDVFVSWGDSRESRRVLDHRAFFDALWLDLWPAARVVSIPEAFRRRLLQLADVDALEERIERLAAGARTRTVKTQAAARTPLRHQVQAITSWLAAGRRGILQHATGSGKTITALLAIKDALRRCETPLVVVPSILLLEQWKKEARVFLGDELADIVTCGGGDSTWRTPGVLAAWTRQSVRPPIVIATMDTAASEQFRARVRGGAHLFIVADEVHRLGSSYRQSILELAAGPRLGLSATPIRAGDPDGTRVLLDWFGPVVQPPYGIGDAIQDGRLCRYFYRTHVARLDQDELNEWSDLSRRLATLQHAKDVPPEAVKMLLLRRARILKQARAKLHVAEEVLRATARLGDRWLVYCDSIDQLQALRLRLDGMPLRVLEYYRGMPGDSQTTLRIFADSGGIVLSIRCLDEGVDIPAADHALIVASSQNPREFIQRRGRVLRHAPRKAYADIHDVLVLPTAGCAADREYRFVYAEVARALEFAQFSENPAEVERLRAVLAEENLDANEIMGLGMENDDEGTDE